MSRGVKIMLSLFRMQNLADCLSVLNGRERHVGSLPAANLLAIGPAPARRGSRAPFPIGMATRTVRFSRWPSRTIGCFLLSCSTAFAAGWASQTSPNGPLPGLCRELLYRLNHTPTSCIATAIQLYPGFKFPPAKTLDASKHLELIARLTAYGGSPITYFRAPLTHLAERIRFARELVQAGDTLEIWHTRLLKYFAADLEDPAPPGDQTIAILARGLSSPDCHVHPFLYHGRTFVVLPDLSGPDPRVKEGPASLLANTYPVLYKGKVLLVSEGFARDPTNPDKLSDYDRVIIYDTSVVVNGPGCWLEYHGNDRRSAEH